MEDAIRRLNSLPPFLSRCVEVQNSQSKTPGRENPHAGKKSPHAGKTQPEEIHTSYYPQPRRLSGSKFPLERFKI